MTIIHFIAVVLLTLAHIFAAAIGGALALVVGAYVLLLFVFAVYTGGRFPWRQLDWIAVCGLIGFALFLWGVMA